MELVRYIHLNPIRARLVTDIKALKKRSSLCLTLMVEEKTIILILSYRQRVSRLKNITEKLKTYMQKAEQY